MTEPNPPANELDKKVVRTSPMLWVLCVIFAMFLSALGMQALSDIADLFHEPQMKEFEAASVKPLREQRERLYNSPNPRKAQLDRAQRDLENEERVLRSAEASWATWLATRGTLGAKGNEDQEVRQRRSKLDTLRRERDQAEKALSDLKALPDPRDAQLEELDKRIEAAEEQAEREYSAAHTVYSWKALLARLGLIIPLWALAVYLWARRQNSKYITLMWGYWAFTVWMLLDGVWPYLPHYSIYIPMTLGAVTTVWVAVTLVRFFNRQAPQRRRKIVDAAIAAHTCPGCERNYLTGSEIRFEQGIARKAKTFSFETEALRPRVCPACRLQLFGACSTCGHQQISHLDYCSSCGSAWKAVPIPAGP